MSLDRITAPAADASENTAQTGTADKRVELAKLAAEFESLLLANMLRDMRAAGRWSEEDSSDTLGAGAFNQTFDTELARSLSQAGGFGLSSFLMQAFDKYSGASSGADSIAAAAQPTDARPAATRPTQVTSAFGWRKDPLTGAMSFHRGVDLKAGEGDPVAATGAGRVVFSGPNGGYGTSVVIEHSNGVKTRYAHLSEALVVAGDQVQEDQTIGKAGHTGRATGPHVHYEVLAGGQAIDPLR